MKAFVWVVLALFVSGVAGAEEVPKFSPESAKAILYTLGQDQLIFFAQHEERIVATKQQDNAPNAASLGARVVDVVITLFLSLPLFVPPCFFFYEAYQLKKARRPVSI